MRQNLFHKILTKALMCLSLMLLCACGESDKPPLVFIGDSQIARWDVESYFPMAETRNHGLSGSGVQWLEENIADSEITVDNLAAYVGMGRTSMYNKLKGLTGKSPVELIQDYRLEKATYYLKSGQLSVSETSYKVGFSDPGYFSRSFKKHFGISPAEYIRTYGPKSSDKTDRNISI